MNKRFAALSLLVFLVVPAVSQAQSVPSNASLQAEVQTLLARLQVLQQRLTGLADGPTTAWCHSFTSNLEVGDSGTEVQALQEALAKDGEDVATSGVFDEETASAVTGFQEKYASQVLTPNGLQHGTGYVGPATRRKLNALFRCGTTVPVTAASPVSVPPTAANPSAYSTATSTSAIVSGSADQPTLKMISRGSGPIGQQLTLTGTGYLAFGNVVYMSGSVAASNLPSSDGTTLSFTVPASLTNPTASSGSTQVTPGIYNISVGNQDGISNAAPFTVIVGSSSESMNISLNPSFNSFAVSRGEKLAKIGSFEFYASTTNENALINTITVTPNTTYFQNLHVITGYGQPFGQTIAAPIQGTTYSFSGIVIVAPGQTYTDIDLYADINLSATGTVSAGVTFNNCVAIGSLSYNVISCNGPVQGQALTFGL